MKTIDKAKLVPSKSKETIKQSIYDIAINSLNGQAISLLTPAPIICIL